tara:strand:- start:1812 stop:2519 length:708 start_codon:yes stop_codon:yes gene_type:complete
MSLQTRIIKPYLTGLHLGSYTYLFSHLLDFTLSKDDTIDIVKKNPSLYLASTISNFKNLLGLSPVYYVFANNLIIIDKTTNIQMLRLLGMLLTHNIIFYNVHKNFHERKWIYFIHKFHHKFVKPIPSNGNAVSMYEYNLAYVLPFIVGALLFKPNEITFNLTIGIISFLNSLVHSGALRSLKIPKLLVNPDDHLIHHEKLDTKYASPLLNIDYFVDGVKGLFTNEYSKYKHTKYM